MQAAAATTTWTDPYTGEKVKVAAARLSQVPQGARAVRTNVSANAPPLPAMAKDLDLFLQSLGDNQKQPTSTALDDILRADDDGAPAAASLMEAVPPQQPARSSNHLGNSGDIL